MHVTKERRLMWCNLISFPQQQKGKNNKRTHNRAFEISVFTTMLLSCAMSRLIWRLKGKSISNCKVTAPSQYAAPLEFHFSDVGHFGNCKTMAQVAVWCVGVRFFLWF